MLEIYVQLHLNNDLDTFLFPQYLCFVAWQQLEDNF